MGTKRPYDDEFQQFIKHPKHLDYGNKLALFSENKLPYDASQSSGLPVEAGCMFYNTHNGEGLESENSSVALDLADKEFETSAPVSLVNGNSGEVDTGFGAVFCPSLFPDYFEFNFPRRPPVHFDDTYSSLLNCSPRKEIPLGSNHQADIPEFESVIVKEQTLSSGSIVGNENWDHLVGACVIPMSNSDFSVENGEAASGCEAAPGRVDCKCLDSGSIRCVQQHVKEARAKLRETLGHDKFMDLGFYDIGEEVAHRWTEEEERLFHEVVYSNPVSLGKNFWEHLATAFPSRTKKELVSYYFNVFMLRRRAVQNRSKFLEIDSDDDEWRGNDREPIRARGDEDDFVVGSFIGHDVRVGHGDDSSSDDDGDDDDDNDDDDDDADADDGVNGDVLIGATDAIEKEGVEFGFKEDSHTPSEGLQNVADTCGPVDGKVTALPENNEKSGKEKCLHGNCDGGLGSEYVLERCDGKVWDTAPYSMGLTKSVDLLSTCSMIEEIFGPSRNDNSIS